MTDEMWTKTKYFAAAEFDRLVPGSANKMDPALIFLLDRARAIADIPFVITSAYRDPDQNAGAGGVDDSAHTRGKAVDIRCHTSISRHLILSALYTVGFRRVGIYNLHIHVDCDMSLTQDLTWTGKSS